VKVVAQILQSITGTEPAEPPNCRDFNALLWSYVCGHSHSKWLTREIKVGFHSRATPGDCGTANRAVISPPLRRDQRIVLLRRRSLIK